MFQFYREQQGERNHNSVYLRVWTWAQGARGKREKQGPASQEHSWKHSSTHVSSLLLQKRSFSKCLVKQRRSQKILRNSGFLSTSQPYPNVIPWSCLLSRECNIITPITQQNPTFSQDLKPWGLRGRISKFYCALLLSVLSNRSQPSSDFPSRVNSAAQKLF